MSAELKKCKTCDLDKSINDYAKKGKGYSTSCKDCVKTKTAATRENKKVEKQRTDARNTFNENWKKVSEHIDAYDLTQIADLLKEYQKEIKTLQTLQ
jgi:hypothetical protein